jgi:hypothetical protein
MNPQHVYFIVVVLVINLASSVAFVSPHHKISFSSIHSESCRAGRCEPRQSTTSLRMIENPALAVAALTGAVSGGLFAGGLHAIAGTLFRRSRLNARSDLVLLVTE